MKKSKLTLTSLKVNSFVTKLSDMNQIKGGTITFPVCLGSDQATCTLDTYNGGDGCSQTGFTARCDDEIAPSIDTLCCTNNSGGNDTIQCQTLPTTGP